MRYELKSVVHRCVVDDLVCQLKSSGVRLEEHYAPRQVNNLYFDTHDYANVEHHIQGSSCRLKSRLRWYGPNRLGAAATLEFKIKRNRQNWKKSFALKGGYYESGWSWKQILQSLERCLPEEASMLMAPYQRPTLLNNYHRRYFIDPKAKFRMTIDLGIRSKIQLFSKRPNLRLQELNPHLAIVEIKVDQENFHDAQRILSRLPLQQRRHSKYLKGIYSEYPY